MNATTAMLLMVLSVCSISCVRTKALWEATDPGAYKEIPAEEVNEDDLKESGRDYYRDLTVDVFHVEKSRAEKFRDYSMRVSIIPLCAVLEPAMYIVAGVAVLATAGFLSGGWMLLL